MLAEAPQIKPCPVCGQTYTAEPSTCSFCGWPLSPLPILGQASDGDAEKAKEKQLKRQQDFCRAALVICWRNGSLDNELFNKLIGHLNTEGFVSQSVSEFREKYQKDFLAPTEETEALIQSNLMAIATGEQNNLILLDDGPDEITLACINMDGDQPKANSIVIRWDEFGVNLPDDPIKRNLALIAGYVKVDAKALGDHIRTDLSELDASPSSPVFLCSRLYGGGHIQIVMDAIRVAGYQFKRVPYLIGDSKDFKSYINTWLERMPLQKEFALAVARVSRDGRVRLHFQPLFPAGVFLDSSKSKQVVVHSLNEAGGQVDLVVVTPNENDKPIPQQAWKADLAFDQKAHLTFELADDRRSVKVSGVPVTSISPRQTDALTNIPPYVSSDTHGLDVVLVIDTIASPETFAERCEKAKEIVEMLAAPDKKDALRFSVIAYGDHYPVGRFSPPGWPAQLRMIKWEPLSEIKDFLDNLTPTSIKECDFESALDEGLYELTRLDWREGAYRWVISIGRRPPHPKRIIPGSYQVASYLGLDWETLVRVLHHEQNVYSFAIECELEWLGALIPYAKDYSNKFWRTFGYTERLDFRSIDAGLVSKKVWNKSTAPRPELRLPVLVEHGERG